LTSVELDHIDIFSSLDAMKDAFKKFVQLIPPDGLLVVAADSPGALEVARTARCRVERYLVARGGEAPDESIAWLARPLASRGSRTLFEVVHNGKPFGVFDFGLSGAYNLANALSVIAVGSALRLTAEAMQRGLRRFAGVKRRQELRGVAQGVRVIDDFAHHPTAVKETLEGLRQRFPGGRIIAIFEPRSATSRRALFQKEYAEAFAAADEIVIGAVHLPEKAPPGDRLDPERLAADLRGKGLAARHLADVSTIIEQVASTAAAGDTVVVMTSGGFEGIHDRLLARLGDAVVSARPGDLPGVHALLERTQLKYPDVDQHVGDLLVLRESGGALSGCVAMELYDEAGLLRALVTSPERRGMGFGWLLADAALNRARSRGCRRVFLVTENASDFFAEKLGFKKVERAMVDASVLESSQFGFDIARATTMVRDLG
jgi:UDP-N-acetylmuramate: L-alanyl-gamma-D-glutamyl-meso-diaminopimelate ligase